jgi:hypothetical protein
MSKYLFALLAVSVSLVMLACGGASEAPKSADAPADAPAASATPEAPAASATPSAAPAADPPK